MKAPKELKEYVDYIAEFVKEKGFYTPPSMIDDPNGVLAKLMLVVSETGEAAEAVRLKDEENFREEIADILIRVFDMCGAMGIDPAFELDKKMAVNEGRPQLHGKVC